jgi:hypothetical protein
MTYVIEPDKENKTLTITFDPPITHPLLPNKSWDKLELHQPELEDLMVQESASRTNAYEGFMKFVASMTKKTNYVWPEQVVKKLPTEAVVAIVEFAGIFLKPS